MAAFGPAIASFLGGAVPRAIAGTGVAYNAMNVGGFVGVNLHALTNPLTRELSYQANAKGPDIVPEVPLLLQALWAGRIHVMEAADLLKYHGITWGPGNGLVQKAWRSAIALQRPTFDLPDYQKWWRQGRINLGDLQDVLARKGFRQENGAGLFMTDRESVPWYVALQLFQQGDLEAGEFLSVMRENGYTQQQAQAMLNYLRRLPTLPETLELWNRGNFTDEQAERLLLWQGFTNDTVRAGMMELRKVIPPVSDLVRFSVREVWNEDVVNRFTYDAEFPPEFQFWLDKQGLGWEGKTPGPAGAGEKSLSWAKAYWRAHWYVISPTEAFHALHRFRGDPASPDTWSVPGIPPFTLEDVRTVLKIHDYPPAFRDRLAALSYSVLRLVDIRAAVRTGARTDEWAWGKFQDRGVTLEDAKFQTDLVRATENEKVLRRDQARHRQQQGQTANVVLESYQQGIIGEPEAEQALKDLQWPTPTAKLAIARKQMEDRLETVQAVLRRARQDFMGGRIDDMQAAFRLAQAGVTPARVAVVVDRWKIERGESRVTFTTAKIIDLVKRGLLAPADANVRLRNLGWGDPDRVLLLAIAWQEIVKGNARLAEIAARKQRAAERELEAQQRELVAALEKSQSIARRQTSKAELIKWLKEGDIGKYYFQKRMRLGGYADEVIRQQYFDVFGEPFEREGNECGTYDPFCGTAPEEGGTTEGEEESGEDDGTAGAADELPGGALPDGEGR